MLTFKKNVSIIQDVLLDKSHNLPASTCFVLLKSKILLFRVDQHLTPGGSWTMTMASECFKREIIILSPLG